MALVASRAVRRSGRSWAQRLLIGFNCVVVVACLGAAVGLTYVERQVSDVPRLSISSALDEQVTSSAPMNILLVGVDDGTGLDGDDPVLTGRGRSLNTDTIMVLRLDPAAERASLLSFPRDTWVPIAGSSSKGKINSALALGGPERLIATIKQNFGIDVHHYVQVNFSGFKSLVREIDGVPLYLPWVSRDVNSGWANDEIGCLTLDADQALSFARSRYFEIYENGRWIKDPYSDLSRAARQQLFIKASLKRAIAKGVRNPFVLNGLVGVAQQNVTLDDQFSTQDIVELGMQFRNFDPEELDVYIPPGKDGFVGQASVLFIDETAAQPIFDIFRGVDHGDDAVPTVRVEVRNGSGRSGEGSKAKAELTARGFAAPRATDAGSFRVTRTEVRYAPGAEVAAVEVARHLDGDPLVVEDAAVPGDVSVVLVTGADFTGIRAEGRPASDFQSVLARATTTTAPPTTAPAETSVTTTTIVASRFIPAAPAGESCG